MVSFFVFANAEIQFYWEHHFEKTDDVIWCFDRFKIVFTQNGEKLVGKNFGADVNWAPVQSEFSFHDHYDGSFCGSPALAAGCISIAALFRTCGVKECFILLNAWKVVEEIGI